MDSESTRVSLDPTVSHGFHYFELQSLYDEVLSQLGENIQHIVSKVGINQEAINSVATEITNGPHMVTIRPVILYIIKV